MVTPNKLKAFVDQQSQPASPYGMAAVMNPSDDPAMGDDDLDDDEDADEEQTDPLTQGNSLISQWGERGEALKEAAGEIIDEAHEVGGDLLLGKPPEDILDEVDEAVEKMPDEIQQCLAKYVVSLSDDDLTALATALVDGHDGETEDADVKLVCAFLKRAAQHAEETVDPEDLEDEEEDEEETDDEDGDGKDGDGDGDGAAAGGDGGAGDGGGDDGAGGAQ